MGIPQKIDEIVAQRQKKLPVVGQMQKRLEEINHTIEALDRVCQEAVSGDTKRFGALLEQYPSILENLRLVSLKAFRNCYENSQEMLQQLYTRFSREQVHISFVGAAGHGKSLVMQNISGLSGDIIPSSEGDDCTGTKSIITNRADSEVKAEITFYSQQEYIDIVNQYLQEIFGRGSELFIHSVDEISMLKQKDLQSQVDKAIAQKQFLFLQLKKYIEHSDSLFPMLGTKKIIPAAEIERYVAQYCSRDKTIKYFTYLGVKTANIQCPFPCSQCGKIVLVDTIGLGRATDLGVREKMLETVSNDSDAILLMIRPDPLRAHMGASEASIINDIEVKMTAEYTRNMLFWVINKVEDMNGRNVEHIPAVLKNLEELTHFPVAAKLVVNCKDRAAVETELLIPVLEQLSNNLSQTDELLLKRAEAQLSKLYQEYHMVAEKIGQAFLATIDQDTRREFSGPIKDTYKKMTNSIRELYLSKPYGLLRNLPCEVLQTAAEQKLRNILTRIPERDEILKLLNDGFINQHNAYEILTDQMRLSIINDFLDLNRTLHDIVVAMKRHIVHILADETQGRLGHLVSAQCEDPDAWLNELAQRMDDYPNYKLIVEALQKLVHFDLRMEGFLIYRVRAHLDVIDISLIPQGPKLKWTLADKGKLAEEIVFWLEHNLTTVYSEIQRELAPLYSYPNSALWAVVKDFYDRVVYSSDQQIDVETSWRYLYEDSIARIWPQKYNSYLAQKGVAAEWNTLVDKIQLYDTKNMFQFGSGEV